MQVTYTVDTFLDKNKDTLSNDLKQMLQSSKDSYIRSLFPPDAVQSMKRPPTAGLQFRVYHWNSFAFKVVPISLSLSWSKQNQVTGLVTTLRSCTPHYIRCMRPNALKAPNNFDERLSSNQIRYLGLLENVRVRRAGYAYRQTYEKFMHRYEECGIIT